jgi:hypothetical protein
LLKVVGTVVGGRVVTTLLKVFPHGLSVNVELGVGFTQVE